MVKLLIAMILATGALRAQVTPPPAPGPIVKHRRSLNPGALEDLPCPQGRNQTEQAHFGDYVIRTYRWPEPEGCLEVFRRGHVVYSLESADFRIGGNFSGNTRIPIGTDITGNGKPDAVVVEWSGGAHCCFTFHVFELGRKFREIGRIDAKHSDTADFVDLRHDGIYEFNGYDWTFAYWGASFDFSPAPRVVLKYSDGRFRLALGLMHTPGLSAEDFTAMARHVRSDDDWSSGNVGKDCDEGCGVPVTLWKNMLNLMYGGHTRLAWLLLNESWPAQLKGKSSFVEQFCKQLGTSPYWADLRTSVGSCPEAADH